MKIAIISSGIKWTPLKSFLLYKKYLKSEFEVRLFYPISENVFGIEGIYPFCNNEDLKNKLEDFNPDIFHINRPLIKKDSFGLISNYKEVTKVEYLYLTYWDEFSHLIDAHISPSSFLILELFKRYRLSENFLSKFFINPYPIDVESILNINKKRVSRIKSELAPNDEILLGIVIRPDKGKAHNQIFARMLFMLTKKLKNFKFIDIGGIPLDFKKRIYPLIKEGIFIDLGPMFGDELYEHLCTLDIFAYFSLLGETFGISIAEAMTAGLPVVLNNTPYSTNAQTLLVDNGINGYVTNSMKGWVDAIIKLANEPELREKMGIRGREKILEKYHPKDVIRSLEDIYEKALKGEMNTKLDIRSMENEFNKRRKNVFDSDFKYRTSSMLDYIYYRIIRSGGLIPITKRMIKVISNKISRI